MSQYRLGSGITVWEFFRGWKRKTGVLTLFLACLCLAGWVRSHRIVDGLFRQQPECHAEIGISSYESCIYFSRLTRDYQVAGVPSFMWTSHSLPVKGLMLNSPDLQWDWQLLGFGVARLTSIQDKLICVVVPYCAIVLPLTLLSLWCLLSKPRLHGTLQTPSEFTK